MAVPKNDFYTLVGDNRYDSAPRSFPYDVEAGAADWSASIFQPPNSFVPSLPEPPHHAR